MTYRSFGKTYDWELEKYRLQKKIVDKGNKRRFLRNIPRFFKNPLAYFAWSTARWYNASVPRLFMTSIILTFAVAAYEYRKHTRLIQEHD